MLRAARFDGDVFLELKEDKTATGQAVAALFLASLGYAIGFTFRFGPFAVNSVLVSILTNLILSLIATLLWSITAFLVATKLFHGKSLFWEMARPLFFSATPGILFILISVPVSVVSSTITAIVAAWVIINGVVAVKNAMGFSYNRSMLTYIVGVLILVAVRGFLPG